MHNNLTIAIDLAFEWLDPIRAKLSVVVAAAQWSWLFAQSRCLCFPWSRLHSAGPRCRRQGNGQGHSSCQSSSLPPGQNFQNNVHAVFFIRAEPKQKSVTQLMTHPVQCHAGINFVDKFLLMCWELSKKFSIYYLKKTKHQCHQKYLK